MTIPNITIPNAGVQPIVINATGIRNIRNVWTWDTSVRDIRIAEIRPWETTSNLVTPLEPPVVLNIGRPIVDMPGCVKAHRG